MSELTQSSPAEDCFEPAPQPTFAIAPTPPRGGRWIDIASGSAAPDKLQSQLNYAAQNAVKVAADKTRSSLVTALRQIKTLLDSANRPDFLNSRGR